MSKTGRALLITGPAGSGKSTLAAYIAEKYGWHPVSEDDYWVKNGWLGHRTEEQEQQVQQQVLRDMLPVLRSGQDVVLEFILYKNPPNPLTNYMDMLASYSVSYRVVALKPPVDEIIHRMRKRGRKDDLEDMANRQKYAESQIKCLEADYIKAEWLIDPTNTPVDELCEKVLTRAFPDLTDI